MHSRYSRQEERLQPDDIDGIRAIYGGGNGGGTNGHVDYCRDYGPCRVGEGDCDGSGQCESGLQCSQDVGASYGFRADYDVCEAASRGGGTNGHVDYCRDYGPCRVGEGDCDGSSQCESGLQCSQDVGASYGFRADYDVCEATSSGGQNGHVDYCRDYGPCRVGEGDCDGSGECQNGLQCRRMWEPATGSGPTTMCVKPPQVAGRTGTWTTVGTMGRAVWAKAIAMGAASARAGSSAARILEPTTGSGPTTMCAKPPAATETSHCRNIARRPMPGWTGHLPEIF